MARNEELLFAVRWSRRLTLQGRILAVNVFALAILAGSLFYLDSFRSRLTTERVEQSETEVRLIADALSATRPASREALLIQLGARSRTRLRLYGKNGGKLLDSWRDAPETYEMRDPSQEPWEKQIAEMMDNAFDTLVGAKAPPRFAEPADDRLAAWPEAVSALAESGLVSAVRRAPEGTPFISAAIPTAISDGSVLLLTVNARDIRRIVRAERLTLGIILATTIALSVLLSLFLARTIARPLRHLARAAHRVRLGREREVSVPLLPERRDEIGLLARAIHDMTQTLRNRIDATEAFAADVTHELKNPLASLRSAVESLERVDDPQLRANLLKVVRNDVQRLDRLIVDIAEISRLDAELSRARYEEVDLGHMIESLLAFWEERASASKVRMAFARPRTGTAVILGEEGRLSRALDNVIDNAISFSPQGGLVEIAASATDGEVFVTVEDEGPGVAPDQREAIFQRFSSLRPEAEDFGRHSGLGLAIAKAIVEGHDGRISVEDRHDERSGARFVMRFPEVSR